MKKILFALVPFLFFSIVLFSKTPIFEVFELKTIDWRFNLKKTTRTTGDVVVVSVDEKSLHREGRWPWSREKIASLMNAIKNLNPRLVGLDIIFAEPSRGDEKLAQSIQRNNNTILGYYFYSLREEMEKASFSEEQINRNFQTILPSALPQLSGTKAIARQMQGVVANLPSLGKVALTQGFFNSIPDRDGVIRKMPLFLNYKGEIFPALTLELFSNYLEGFDPLPIYDSQGSLLGLNIKTDWIPTDPSGKMWINYHSSQKDFSVISATDLMAGLVEKKALENKVVLVGATAVGIYDLRVTPFSPVTPGVFVQADTLDTLLRRDFLQQDFKTQLASWLGMLFLTICIFWILSRQSLLFGLFMSLIFIASYISLTIFLFQKNIILAMVAPSLEGLIVAFGLVSYRGFTEEFEKRKIRKIFQSYLHPDVIEEIVQSPDTLGLAGRRAECSILFSDVRNFTTISEKMDPVTLLELMNSYFDPISNEILKETGYIDKFIGDAVMAVFGVPKALEDHAFKACRAALAMKKKVEELEPEFKARFGVESFKTGIGIHTGPVTVGNVGTKARLNYTVMGDTVNLASRLEGETKALQVTILISESTYQAVHDKAETRYLDEIAVKGKTQKVRVYELLGLKDNAVH